MLPQALDILVVDDEASIASVIAEALGDEQYSVRTAYNGVAALRAIAERVPALVLIDHMMPGISGREVVHRLRGDGYTSLPIILMSAVGRAEQFLGCGATAFLPKPFELADLLALVAEHIPLAAAEIGAPR